MKCVLCVPFKWLGSKVTTPCSTRNEAIAKKLSSWSVQQANNQEIWNRDTEQERIREAIRLGESLPVVAFQSLLNLAENGSVWSMLHVGWAYETGNGIALDAARAERW